LETLHAMTYASLETLFFIPTEIVANLLVQDAVDRLVAFTSCLAVGVLPMILINERLDRSEIPRIVRKARGHVLDRQNEIDNAGGNRRVRHACLQGAGTVPPWAKVRPPRSLIALMPSVPSLPPPERRMPTDASPSSSASELKKTSIGLRWASSARNCSRSLPSVIVMM